MKISVDVETEAHSYEPPEVEQGKRIGLKWRIDVTLDRQRLVEADLPLIAEDPEAAPRASVSRARVSRVSRVDLSSAGAEHVIRKLSSTSELIERMGRGRKVICFESNS